MGVGPTDPHVHNHVSGPVHGNVVQAHTVNTHPPIPVLESSAPGVVLVLLGAALVLTSFGGWASIVFRAVASGGATRFGPVLPSGVPLPAFYFITVVGGGVVFLIGGSIATRDPARRRWVVVRHTLVAAAVIAGLVVAVDHLRGEAPYADLLPHFADCGASTGTGAPVPTRPSREAPTLREWVCATPVP
ncbi:hypothetical protein [Saccharothrix syringae]|uniref:hypothetical protein n=1 Tax=Saccharothrix syringae TaxID=103733 RepID=UPI00129333DC|nr:hypothetical protein [Saccharothrix syringae]